jgi:hypothetical protein
MADKAVAAPGRSWRWGIWGLVPLFVAALLLFGLIALGQVALDHLRDHERYTIPFAEIDCAPPSHQEREDFLGEVRYLSGFPNWVRLLEDGLPARLAEAFARHPWVEKVERVEVIPPRQVRVRLTYRQPVLAVPYAGQWRAVDRTGVLLPATASVEGLPVYRGHPRPPSGPAGTPWGDEAIEEAARKASP